MASRGVVAMRVLYSVLLIHLAAALAAAAADALPSVVTDTPTNLARRHHHHCIHDENLDLFTSTVDPESLASPQRLMPHADSYAQSLIIDEYLDALGLPVQMSRRRALSATGTEASFQPLRIAFDLSKLGSDPGYMCTKQGDVVKVDGQSYTCTVSDLLTPSKKEFIVSVLLKAISDRFGSVLSVQSVVGNLIIAGISCSSDATWACCSNAIPSSYRTEGVADADYLLHVTARPTTGSTIAWALPCNIDQFGRPISGHANFGPARLDPSSTASRSEQIGTALHEMTHALVFSKSRFVDFRQPLNGAKWGYSNVVAQSQSAGSIYVSKIVTPSVVKQIKQHFNCFDWVGAGIELENGDKGSAEFSSHWDKRVVMNEYMSATSSYDPVYSALTLALFEDSGWYQVSYASAEVLPWGFLEGCGLAQAKCSTWNSRYACSDAKQEACTSDYNAKGYCNVAEYSSSIPAGFQYFQDPKFGGRDTYADYCPFYRAYSNGDCRDIGYTAASIDTDNWMESVGSTSKCFSSSLSKRSSSSAALRPTCYQVLGCTSTTLRLSIGGKDVDCPLAGGTITVNGYRGSLVCPDTGAKLCQLMQNQCSGAGVLLSTGVCQCNPGYGGDDCSRLSCPANNGDECDASSGHGTCDYSTGLCKCASAYTGLSCSDLVCPTPDTTGKNTTECSGHGTCDHASGTCTCSDGYSGKACECVPGCSDDSCGDHGTCDCKTGACVCAAGYNGVTCGDAGDPAVVELGDDDELVDGTVAEKEYAFFKIYLNASTYDITLLLTGADATVDVDLYGSFVDEYPSSLTTASVLFASVRDDGAQDAIHLCGTLGVFPRGLNDELRYCARATTAFIQETPGVFYLSVLGYTAGSFTLSVETDKCRGVTCSNHGSCGVDYAGVCSCDRYWSGDDCSVPKCGPDCQDMGTCSSAITVGSSQSGSAFDSEASTSGSLRNTSECYGNGECQVLTNSSGYQVPTCVCDEAYNFSNPTTRAQELCKQLIPSVAYVRHYTDPFVISSDLLDLYVTIGAWALYTIAVQDDWQVLVATLEATTPEADAMLFVRKEKLPAAGATATTSSGSYIQFMDAASWTAGSMTRKVVLSRATSTLSSGLYYLGVYNSPYGRAALGYTLTVNATANCSGSTSESFGICQNGGECNALASDICTCPDSFAGKFCGLNVTRTVLVGPSSGSESSSASWTSYEAFTMENASMVAIGEWVYYSFDVNDTGARLVQFELVIDNPLDDSVSTPVRPLLLVRGPSDSDFPTLTAEALQDFPAVAARQNVQTVALAVGTACSFESNHKHCYKVAVHNRPTAGAALRFRLRVTLFSSLGAAFPSRECASVAAASGADDSANDTCHGHGQCSLAQVSGEDGVVPSCSCSSGWTGLRCASPTAFDPSQLWSALANISLLCTTCSSASFTLSRGQVRMFRVPEPLRANVGLRLSVVPVDTATGSGGSGTVPNVYVSELLPRSIYDFSFISVAANASATSQTVDLPGASLSGHFWVIVYSDYAASTSTVNVTTSTNSSTISQSRRARRRLGSTTTGAFRLVAAQYKLSTAGNGRELLTDRSFAGETFAWLVHSSWGRAVLGFSVALLLLLFSFCLWRVWRAPENQDALVAQHFGDAKPQARSTRAGATLASNLSLAPLGTATVVDSADSPPSTSTARPDIEMGLMAPSSGPPSTKAKPEPRPVATTARRR